MTVVFNIRVKERLIEEAGSEIKKGKIVVYPTVTVYGLGTNPSSEDGARRCFSIKKREMSKPLPILYSSLSEVNRVAVLGRDAHILSGAFWPGKLTMILPLRKTGSYPEIVTGTNKTVAARIPSHPFALRLIKHCGGSLIGTSANLSGKKSIVDPEDPELAKIASKCDFFMKGRCRSTQRAALSSTIIDLTLEEPAIVREGAVPAKRVLLTLRRREGTTFPRGTLQ